MGVKKCCPCLELAGEFVGMRVSVQSIGNTTAVGILRPISPTDKVIKLEDNQGDLTEVICCNNIFSISPTGNGGGDNGESDL